jgi:outer membrane protein assembly factor BamB
MPVRLRADADLVLESRRLPLAQLAAVALAVLATAPAAAHASADESVAYQVTPGHTGFSSGGSLDRPPLDVRWMRTLGSSPGYTYPSASTSYPLVADGRVFVIAYDSQHAGGTLFALDSLTGATLWSRGVDGTGQIAYDNGNVFVSEASGTVVAVAADTGATEWARVLPQSFEPQSPVAADGVLYVDSAWDGGGLYALNEADGSTKWFTSFYFEGSPAFAGGVAYVSDDYEGSTAAFSAAAGSLLWSGSTECTVSTGHVLADGARVIAPFDSSCGSVVDAATGAALDSIASNVAPAAAGDVAVVLDGSTLQGRSLQTGLLLWQFAGDGSLSTAPLIVNGTVYEGSSTGELFAVDLRTGTQVWSGSIAPSGTVAGVAGMAAGDGLLVVPAGGTVTGLEATAPARPGLDLQIDAGPDGPTNSTQATLTFGSSDPSATELCRLDDSAWSSCDGTVSYAGLSSGPHMFEVETVDQTDGSTIGLAVRGWSVVAGLPPTGATGGTGSTPLPTGGGALTTPTTTTTGGQSVPDGAASPSATDSPAGATDSAASSRNASLEAAALLRVADATLARTLANAGATLLHAKTRAELRARPSVYLYSAGPAAVSIGITERVNGRSTTLATVAARFPAAGGRDVRLELTRAGRAALAKRGRLSLTVRATVAPAVGTPVTASSTARV